MCDSAENGIETIKLSGFEASGVKFSCKYHNPNPEVIELQELKKIIWDKLGYS